MFSVLNSFESPLLVFFVAFFVTKHGVSAASLNSASNVLCIMYFG